MTIDRVQPLKLEDSGTGGEETDAFPTALDRNEDFIDCHGLTLQNVISNDDIVRIQRSEGNLEFLDAHNTPITLTTLLTNTAFNSDRILINTSGSILINQFGNILVSG